MATKSELYKLTKEMLFAKFDGHCAFCGYELKTKWHILHLEPNKTIVKNDGTLILGNDEYENKLPACISCNSTKVHRFGKEIPFDIEKFRNTLYSDFMFLRSDHQTYYHKCIKYGLIEETNKPIVFYFEKMGIDITI